MRLVVVTGIYPPDIGGPATHGADLAAEFRDRGHEVTVVTLADGSRRVKSDGVVRFPRAWPWPLRMVVIAGWLIVRRKKYDAVYATSMVGVATVAARLARRPVVVKIVGDAAWERASRLGLTALSFDAFQDAEGGPARVRAMRAVRNFSVRRASAVVTPSEHLQHVVERWIGSGANVSVVRNGVRVDDAVLAGGRPERRPGLDAVFVGRLVAVKRVDLLIDAVARAADVTLTIVGDGPERESLEHQADRLALGERVVFAGSLSHDEVLRRVSAADVAVNASTHEGLPHALIEALVCGTPVVAPPAGGIVEMIESDRDGILVDPPTAPRFAAVLEGLACDPEHLRRLRKGAAESGLGWRFDRCADVIERLVDDVVGCAGETVEALPRVVFFGKTRIPDPPSEITKVKFALHAQHLDQVSVNTGPAGVRHIGGVRVVSLSTLRPAFLGGLLFYTVGPIVATMTAVRRHAFLVCQSPYEGAGVMLVSKLLPHGRRPRVQVEVHGDWRTASRMYGSRARRMVAPAADRVAEAVLRRADHVRVVSELLGERVRQAGYTGDIDRFITFSDYGALFDADAVPPPSEPRALFVGVLEPYKAVDVLVEAWPAVLAAVPNARLSLVGAGPMERALRTRIEALGVTGTIQFLGLKSRVEVMQLLDASSCLVLPSRSEGLARVVIEAMARARPVVASTVGGIREVIDDHLTGRLVPAEDAAALSDALVDVLSSRQRAASMGERAREVAVARNPRTEYEAGIVRLVERINRR